jgi:polyphosphate kinase
MNDPNRRLDNSTYPRPEISPARRPVVERAQSLAHGLRSFRPAQDLPEALWEIAYLGQESQNRERMPLERLRILGLMATSLDQFFVEQLPLWQNYAVEDAEYARRLLQLPAYIESLLQRTAAQLRVELLPSLTDQYAVRLHAPDQLSSPAREWLRRFFQMRVYPLLTPQAVDPGHPFPFISSFSLNFIVLLRSEPPNRAWEAPTYARIKVPRLLPRFIALPAGEGAITGDRPLRDYIQSEEVVRFFLPELFPGLVVEGAFLFRVVRGVQPDEEARGSIQRRLRQRELTWPVVRLDVEKTMPASLLDWLNEHLDAPPYACFRLPDPLGDLQLVDLANLLDSSEGGARSELLGDFPLT